MAETKIKYVQLEPSAFLTDIDFQMMNAEQRGVYCSVIFYLYCNNGKLVLSDNSDITLLSHKYSKLAAISNCYKVGSEWDAIWSKITDKFEINGNILTHKRVTEELKRAREYRDKQSLAGTKGMASRYGYNTVITKESKVKESKVKVKESKGKKKHKDFVFLTPEEFQKLVEKLGKQKTEQYITKLNNYIGSKGRRYKSHYHTILVWISKDEPKPRKCSRITCNKIGVYVYTDDTGQKYWRCEEHKRISKSFPPDTPLPKLKSVPETKKESLSDKINKQKDALGVK